MTRNEAIDLLDNLIGMVEDNHSSDYDTALQMGIKALNQEPSDDCVSRAHLISKLEILERRYGSDFYWETRKIVDKLPSVKKEPDWIPVSERLPKEDGRYLCTYEDDIEENCVVDFGSYENGEWYVDKVIAWMPLPKTYKGE